MIIKVTPVVNGLTISWPDFVPPPDFEFFKVYYGTDNPPATLWGQTTASQVTLTDLTPGTTYYVQVFAYDCFGPGDPSGVASGVPLASADTTVGGGSGTAAGDKTLSASFQDIVSLSNTVTAGHVVLVWGTIDVRAAVADITLQLVRRLAGGGGNPPPEVLRTAIGYVLTDQVSIPIIGQDTPTAGTWEYVIQAKTSTGSPIASNAFIMSLVR